MHVQISLGMKFQFKLTTLIFWTKSADKVYFWSKTQKVNTTIKFRILELFYISELIISVLRHYKVPK